MTDIEAKELINKLEKIDLLGDANYLGRNQEIKSNLKFENKINKDLNITIIIPAYRRPDLFKRALQSAFEQNSFDEYEIVVADDSEELAAQNENIVKELSDKYSDISIRYYKNEKALGWYNWNRLLELSNTKWVCMLHDDDILCDMHLYYMSEILKKACNDTDSIGMLTCNRVFFRNQNAKLSICKSDILNVNPGKLKLKDINFQFASFMLGALIDREKAISIGGFNDGIISLDYEFIARMLTRYDVYSSPLYTYGYGVKNNESTKSDMWEKMLISEYFLCKCISKRRGMLSFLAQKVVDYSTAGHAYDMSHPSGNIYGVQLDPVRLCKWLGIDYSIRNKSIMRIYRKILT